MLVSGASLTFPLPSATTPMSDDDRDETSAFVGFEVTHKETVWIDGSRERPILLRAAVLFTPAKKPSGRVAVRICDSSEENNDVTATVCVLSAAAGGLENVPLGIVVNSRVGVTLAGAEVTGAVVHITGAYCDPEDESDSFGLDSLTEDEMMMLAQGGDLVAGDSDSSDDLVKFGGYDGNSSEESSSDGEGVDSSSDDMDVEKECSGDVGRTFSDKERKKDRLAGREGSVANSNGAVVVKKTNKISKHVSGLKFQELLVGTGRMPTRGRNVAIKYTLRLESGKLVDKSRKAPFKFRLGVGEVIKGMDIGVETMREGGQRHLIIPPELGYGSEGSPPAIPKNSMLFFDITLVRAW